MEIILKKWAENKPVTISVTLLLILAVAINMCSNTLQSTIYQVLFIFDFFIAAILLYMFHDKRLKRTFPAKY